MNGKRSDPNQRLLNDVWQDDTNGAWAAAAKQRALAAFRRGRLLRRITILSRLAALFLVLVTAILLLRRDGSKSPSPGRSGRERAGQPKQAGATESLASTPLPTLTDEQLLASFPPDTCYLAEVEGRKVLVFADSSSRKKYLH
jgi:hypothetical protein